MKSIQRIVFLILSVVIISSCVSRTKLTYLKYSNNSSSYDVLTNDINKSVTPSAYKINPYDNLFIRVITPDPQWSELFNATPVGTGTVVTEETAGLFGYTVDIDGNIEIPFVGKIEVAGQTLSEIKVELDSVFKYYVADAAITVKLINNYITLIGEVSQPGRYRLTKERVTVFEALALAGDMDEFSNRQKVQLIRPSPYGPIVKEFSLADRSILSSEFYYMMPNDIIYAAPMKGRSFQVNSAFWMLFLTTVTSALGVLGFFRTL